MKSVALAILFASAPPVTAAHAGQSERCGGPGTPATLAEDEPTDQADAAEPEAFRNAEPQPPGTRVGVLPLVIEADAAPEVGDARERLSEEVRQTLAQTSYEVVLLSEAQSGDAQAPYCGDSVCWQQLAVQHDVTHFLVMVVHFTDPDYRIEARLVDGRTGVDAGEQAMTCDLCGIAELGERVRDVAATMRREVEATLTPPPTLVVTSSPAGATVTVDGEPVGVTPLELTSVAGRHRVQVVLPEYVAESRDVELVDGVRREVSAQLRRIPAPAVAPTEGRGSDRSPVRLGLGAAAVAVGAGSIAGGAFMLAIDGDPIEGDCDGANVDALGRCRYLHDTRGGGVALVAVGIAGVAAGVTLLVLSKRKPDPRRASVWPAGLGLVGRF